MGTLHTSTCQHGDSHKMSERRKSATKKLEKLSMNPKTPMTKEQKEVTDWLKCNVPTKRTKFLHSHVVEYFCGNKAVDLLMSGSKWSTTHRKGTQDTQDTQDTEGLVFDTREQCVEYLDTLLRYKMFHRAKKIPVAEKEKKGKKKNVNNEEKEDKTDTDIDKFSETGEDEKVEKPEKKKRKIRL